VYLANFSYDVLPVNRQRVIDLIDQEVEAPTARAVTPGSWCR
jgi:hypothetical protein